MFSSGELFAMVGMAFALIMTLVIGGFVLLFPVARRLGQAVEEWIKLRRRESSGELPSADLAGLGRAVESMRDELERVAARQDFVESLLESHAEETPAAERKRVGTARDTS